jgi:hypothetical protein
MAKLVVNGAKTKCSQGTSPGSLSVVRAEMQSDDKDGATVQDYQPNTNVLPFGMCQSMSNPSVASATAAAEGTLTPQPCVPMTTSAWSPGASKTKIKDDAALTDDSKCTCSWGGTIEITAAGGDTEVG